MQIQGCFSQAATLVILASYWVHRYAINLTKPAVLEQSSVSSFILPWHTLHAWYGLWFLKLSNCFKQSWYTQEACASDNYIVCLESQCKKTQMNFETCLFPSNSSMPLNSTPKLQVTTAPQTKSWIICPTKLNLFSFIYTYEFIKNHL